MAIVNRQNNLFAAEDWTVAYKAFSQVDFQAYDFDTIKDALVDYVRTNFPENFNDYIESSEFVAIIEMLAFLSQSLAFRMDINSRENFLETAERRDSVFKLARMLGYNPRRNVPASGLLKIDAVRTTETLTDSLGNELNNLNIYFDDANNPDSYEQFITVINAALSTGNRFTTPVKTGTVGGIQSEIYEIQTQLTAPLAYSFKTSVSGITRSFEVVNSDFKDGGVFEEVHPDVSNNFNIIYRNDGQGISSNNTGFFVMFKQGTLSTTVLDFDNPVENRVEDISIAGINETDVFLQEVDTNGFVLNKWSRIPNTVGQTLTYNDVALDNRNLYAVENLDNDGIRLKFPDGTFGNVPYGTFRLYTRSSDGESFTLHPEDARNISVKIPYENATGESHTLTMVLSLQSAVNNSLPTETLSAIKNRAPQVYYTQNRMVSAQDYNVFPYSQSTNITKLKSINRTHAGHSRYIDINDPTGTFQNLETFAQDGALYSEVKNSSGSFRISNNNTVQEVLQYDLPELLKDTNLNNFMYNQFRKVWQDQDPEKFNIDQLDITFKTLPVITGKSQTGYFTETSSVPGTENVLVNTFTSFKMFQENNFLKFVNPQDESQTSWARIVQVDNNGALSSGLSTASGSFTISDKIQHDWKVYEYLGTMRKEFNDSEKTSISAEMESARTFALGYDTELDSWYVIQNENIDKTGLWNPLYAKNTSGNGLDASWLLLCTFSNTTNGSTSYNVTMRGQEYIVESKNDLKFYNINNVKVADTTNTASQDLISFTTLNFKPGSSETFTWVDTDDDGLGDSFRSNETNELYEPINYQTNIPLRSRSTKWHDVTVDWKTNLGIFRNGDVASNLFVNYNTIPLQTYFKTDDSGNSEYANITLSNNTGIINYFPGQITTRFSNTSFGFNILAANGELIYRDLNPDTGDFEVFHANTTITISHGVNDNTPNVNAIGRVKLVDANITTQTGNIQITEWSENNHTHVRDVTGLSRDQLIVNYKFDKEKLDSEINWSIISPVKYADGYTDNKKVVVKPLDSDGDLVPDRPLQFSEFVGTNDLVFFDHYTDFDGYTYSRPFTGNILDLRNEDTVVVDLGSDPATVSPGSYVNETELSTVDLVIVKNNDLISNFENSVGLLGGLVIYSVESGEIYKLYPASTDPNDVDSILQTESEYFVRNGRAAEQNTAEQSNDEVIFKWKHVAPKDVRIDPSISNVVEMLILTTSYYSEVQKYLNVPGTEFPFPPTSAELANEFSNLDEFKSASDTLVFKSAKFKRLFGTDADESVQAKFRVVKLRGTTLSDNEIKSRIIRAMNTYFDVENWEFGETFYFTELSSFIHQQLGSNIGSIVILPKDTSGTFGDLFQVKADPNELFVSTATVNDIEVVEKISSQTLRTNR